MLQACASRGCDLACSAALLAATAFLWRQVHPSSHQLMQAIVVAIELSQGYAETKRKAARGLIQSGRALLRIAKLSQASLWSNDTNETICPKMMVSMEQSSVTVEDPDWRNVVGSVCILSHHLTHRLQLSEVHEILAVGDVQNNICQQANAFALWQGLSWRLPGGLGTNGRPGGRAQY